MGSRSRSRSRSNYKRARAHSRSPMSNRRRHEGNREDPTPSKCIGVFGLSLYTSERELEQEFKKFGPLEKVQVVLDGHSGRSRGFAFIYYETIEDATEARNAMSGAELDGRKIRVDFSITKRPHTPTPGMYMGRPSRDFRRGGRGGYRDSRPSYDRYGGGGGDRYRDDRRDRGYDRYDDRDRDRYYDDRDRYERRDDRDRYHDRRGGPSHGGYPEDRRYDSYPPAPPSGYGKRPRPRSPSPYERDSRPRREYRSRSREYDRRY